MVKTVCGNEQDCSRKSIGVGGTGQENLWVWSRESVGLSKIGEESLREWVGLVKTVCGSGRDSSNSFGIWWCGITKTIL